MEQRLANTWQMTVNERKFIEMALAADLRVDDRGPFDYRPCTITFGRHFSFTNRVGGSSEVQLGETRVMSYVTSQLVQPYRDRPNEGTLSIFTEFSPMADPAFEAGRPGEFAIELGRIVDRGLRESGAVDMESLCVVVGKLVWSIRVDLHILDNGGNLIDAANIAALASLLTFRRPECTLGGDDNHELIIHDIEDREPLPLIIHHLPVAVTFAVFGEGNIMVIDPSYKEESVMGGRMTITMNSNGDICAVQKAGIGISSSVIIRCLEICAVKAAEITSKINHAMESFNDGRSIQYPNFHPVDVAIQDNLPDVIMDKKQIENLIGHLAALPLDALDRNSNKSGAVVVGTNTRAKFENNQARDGVPFYSPSNWDPYPRKLCSRLARSSLKLSGLPEDVEEDKVNTTQSVTVECGLEHTKGASSSRALETPSEYTTVEATSQYIKAPKTLKDAVKIQNRKMRK
ncbi:hypothetical protein ZIOFF_046991 [Zingiber officinale]|uniref:Protein ECERIFERUM 7 n=1 Tax=Zingiber officinale TaxID=94328 RepID=A0A8J5FNH4_ZINOF|nr:hypothetical protein ZIOFF_046991 [Zingiber officinale]